MALTDMTVRQAKTTGKDYTLGDLDGLSLHVEQRSCMMQDGPDWAGRISNRVRIAATPSRLASALQC